jgi:hypothetical protein
LIYNECAKMPAPRLSRRSASTVLGVLVVTLGTKQARAYCREVTESAPAGYDPTVLGCLTTDPEAGTILPPLFWRNQCTSYSLQRNASKQVSLDDAERVAQQAFTTWSTALCPDGGSPSIVASAFPPVDCDSVPSQEHNNVILFRDDSWPYDDSANSIGYTTLTVWKPTGEILGADIEINTASYVIVANGTPPQGAYDLASILTHEAGHFFGLAHSADTTAVMYAFYHPGSTTLEPDDIAGICAIYDPNGSRNTAQGAFASTLCQPQPPLGFEDACGSLDASVVDTDASDGDGGTPVATDTLFGCGIARRPGDDKSPPWAAAGLLGFGAWARRARRTSRRARGAARSAGLSLALLAASATSAVDARASVSVTVLFDDLIHKASAVAVVTPVEQRALWEDHRIVTYTRAHVERSIAGRLEREVWIRTLGGFVGNLEQIVEGQATFSIGSRSLVFIHPHLDPVNHTPTGAWGVVEGAQGQFPIVVRAGQAQPRLAVSQNVGALVPSPSGGRLAREALNDRALDDASNEIATVWSAARREERGNLEHP